MSAPENEKITDNTAPVANNTVAEPEKKVRNFDKDFETENEATHGA